MIKKKNPSPEKIVYRLINSMMNAAEPNAFSRVLFEMTYIEEGYPFDWNKRLNEKGEWIDKNDVKE